FSVLPCAAGTPHWGSHCYGAVGDHYTHPVSLDADVDLQAYRNIYLDLDPIYKDILCQPLVRKSFERQDNDINMSPFMHGRMHIFA
ncbi:GMC family oxidoreductase, partial [Erwinia amylovora]|nr:GMC family oxidoreductase [Erwinia amylovora]